jgi:hypothetical protein
MRSGYGKYFSKRVASITQTAVMKGDFGEMSKWTTDSFGTRFQRFCFPQQSLTLILPITLYREFNHIKNVD